MLEDYTCLLTISTFIGSIALFSDYLKKLRSNLTAREPIEVLYNFFFYLNYLSVSYVWIIILLLLIFPIAASSPPTFDNNIYIFAIYFPLIICVSIITITIIVYDWIEKLNKLKFTWRYQSKKLIVAADQDIQRLKNI